MDVFERLPTPFGLVRSGVAPDHADVKRVTTQLDAVIGDKRCNFLGNVAVGKDVALGRLRAQYHAVVLAYGAASDSTLGLPGEQLTNVLSARAFVGWYNGLPELADLSPNLDTDTVVVVGVGNVAIDVSRMLLCPHTHIAPTDMASHALAALQRSRIRRVLMVGRRGPLEATFTIKEVREMTRMPGCHPDLLPSDYELNEAEKAYLAQQRPKQRLFSLMQDTAKLSPNSDAQRTWQLRFRTAPMAIEASSRDPGCVGAVRLQATALQGTLPARTAVVSGEPWTVPCGLVLRSVGYKGESIDPSLPFDARRGVVLHDAGRVQGQEGLYCSGWIKRGATGIIATTMADASQTAGTLLADIAAGRVGGEARQGLEGLQQQLPGPVVSYADWKKLEAFEASEGARAARVAEKVTSVQRMLDIIGAPRPPP